MDSMYFLQVIRPNLDSGMGGGRPRGPVYSYLRPPELPTLRPEFKHCVQSILSFRISQRSNSL